MIEFWNNLHESGDLRVDAPGGAESAADEAALRAGIAQVEAHWRLELAGEPPPLVMPVAVWAAQTIYRACQFLVYREVDPQAASEALAIACPLPPTSPASDATHAGPTIISPARPAATQAGARRRRMAIWTDPRSCGGLRRARSL